MGIDTRIYWLTDRQSQCDSGFYFDSSVQEYVYDHIGNKQKSYKIMITKMFAILDKARPDNTVIPLYIYKAV
jgi:hypothetical protein